MVITTKQQRQQRRNEALQLISSAKPATKTAGSNPLHCNGSQRKSTSKPAGKGPGGKSIAAQSISAIYTPKGGGTTCHLTKQTLQATPTPTMTLITHRTYIHKNLLHDRAHYWHALMNKRSNKRTYPEEQLRSLH